MFGGVKSLLYLWNMNYGQHILYGYLCSSIHGQRKNELTMNELSEIESLVIELTSLELYDGKPLDTPDVQTMIRPQDSFDIFCEWYDENQTYFEDYLAVSE